MSHPRRIQAKGREGENGWTVVGGKERWADGESGVHKTCTPSTPVGYKVGYKVGYIRGLQQIEAEEGEE